MRTFKYPADIVDVGAFIKDARGAVSAYAFTFRVYFFEMLSKDPAWTEGTNVEVAAKLESLVRAQAAVDAAKGKDPVSMEEDDWEQVCRVAKTCQVGFSPSELQVYNGKRAAFLLAMLKAEKSTGG